jgi:PAS domain S-box-containing protein
MEKSTNIDVLLVEDNPGDARLLRELLRDNNGLSSEVVHVQRLRDAVEHLRRAAPDVILLDLSLPDSQGLDTVSAILEIAAEVPVVVLTGHRDERLAEEALRAGAQEYLIKAEISPSGLARVIRYARERKARENEQRNSEAALSLLHRLTLAIGQAEDLHSALSLVLQEVCEKTGWVLGESWFPDRNDQQLEPGPAYARPDSSLEAFVEASRAMFFERGVGLPGRVWQSGEAVWVPDAISCDFFCRRAAARAVGLRAAAGIPVLAGDQVAAVLAFFQQEPGAEDPKLVRLVTTAAAQLGALVKRKRIEQAFRESEARLRGLMETSYEGIWMLDADERTEYVNPRMAAMLGYSGPEMFGRPLSDFLAESARGDRAARLQRRRKGESDLDEIQLRRKDGRELWVLTSSSPVRSDDGEFRGSVVMVNDITGRKRAQAAERLLAEAGEVFTASLDYQETLRGIAQLLVPRLADWCVIDVLGESGHLDAVRITASDPRKQHILEEMLNRYPHDSSPASHPVGGVLQSGEPLLLSEITPAKIGVFASDAEHEALLTLLAPRSSMVIPLVVHGRVFGAMTLSASESGRSYSRSDLELGRELGRRAALAIENARLYQQELRALRSRDEVLGFVAHDLRNPLSAVTMSASVLLETPVTEAQTKRMLKAILRATDQMDHLIQDLLDVSRIEAGKMQVDAEPLNPRLVIGEATDMLQPQAEERGLTLVSEVDESLPDVRADRLRILQVLSNLIGNAVKFTPGGGTITLRAERQGDEVRFSVADTGSGVPAEQLPHLFDRFWQARATRRAGAGLGLAIAKGLIETHGGKIWAESALERGSTFHFTLPVDPGTSGGQSAGGPEQAQRAGWSPLQATASEPGQSDDLSEDAREVLVLAAAGYTSSEIGKRIGRSPAVVDRYRSRLMHRLRLRNRSELSRLVVQAGWTATSQVA